MSIQKYTGTFKSFDGTPIYYEVRGEGPPLIFCYGIVCTINHWRHQIRYFSNNYKTIVFDYRGHHNSGIPLDRNHLSIDGIAQDIKHLCDHLDIENAGFWGHSFGTQVLIRTFDMYPQLFKNLISVNGFATNPIKGMFGLDITNSAFKLIKQGYGLLPETLSYLWKAAAKNPVAMTASALAGGFNTNLTSIKDIEIYGRGVANVELDVFLQLFEQMTGYDGTPVLDRINVPTLIVGGSNDTVTALHYQETMHKAIKTSELLIVPYGSHCTQLDMPDYLNLRAEKFLRQHGYEA